jgi:hypothetical protein
MAAVLCVRRAFTLALSGGGLQLMASGRSDATISAALTLRFPTGMLARQGDPGVAVKLAPELPPHPTESSPGTGPRESGPGAGRFR